MVFSIFFQAFRSFFVLLFYVFLWLVQGYVCPCTMLRTEKAIILCIIQSILLTCSGKQKGTQKEVYTSFCISQLISLLSEQLFLSFVVLTSWSNYSFRYIYFLVFETALVIALLRRLVYRFVISLRYTSLHVQVPFFTRFKSVFF